MGSDSKQAKRDLAHLVQLVEEGSIHPKILDSVSLGKVARAQEEIETKKVNGFVLCEPWVHTKRSKKIRDERERIEVHSLD